MSRAAETGVGLAGTGADVELETVRESSSGKALLLRAPTGEEIWMPASAFDEEGLLKPWGVRMLEDKLEEAGAG
jgi:hypothetical protein